MLAPFNLILIKAWFNAISMRFGSALRKLHPEIGKIVLHYFILIKYSIYTNSEKQISYSILYWSLYYHYSICFQSFDTPHTHLFLLLRYRDTLHIPISGLLTDSNFVYFESIELVRLTWSLKAHSCFHWKWYIYHIYPIQSRW